MTRPDLGDHVRIVSVPLTEELGYAGREGTCFGFTTPSITGVSVIGETSDDLALSVSFEGSDAIWFAPELVEFLDHGAGTVAKVGNHTYVRTADGDWAEQREEG
jgi:hypothetical protein